jgi:hypothetical protein
MANALDVDVWDIDEFAATLEAMGGAEDLKIAA